MYINVKQKLHISLIFAILWCIFSFILAEPWISDLSKYYYTWWSYALVMGIAILPGFFNAFLLISLLFDKRPKYTEIDEYPDITILIAAYNEENTISDTLESILKQEYAGNIEIVICNDGSIDNTIDVINEFINSKSIPDNITITISTDYPNKGKSHALNTGLDLSNNDLIITIDADSYLYKDALKNLLNNYISGPTNTAAVAGTVLVRNSRKNWITKLQEWEYFISLSLVKRTQSLFQGTLVAQGAFSLYTRDVLNKLGGWPNVVGEDIVLTWGVQNMGYRVGHAENAIIFTNVPDTYTMFFNQRRRWSRGLIEAFKQYPGILLKIKPNSIFVWLNLFFPYMDFMFMFGFVPGLFFALAFQWYEIVSIMTIILLPMAITANYIIYLKHIKTFEEMKLKVRKNYFGYMYFILVCQLLVAPACLRGYTDELLKLKKEWGTKKYMKKTNESMVSFFDKLVYTGIVAMIISALTMWPFFIF